MWWLCVYSFSSFSQFRLCPIVWYAGIHTKIVYDLHCVECKHVLSIVIHYMGYSNRTVTTERNRMKRHLHKPTPSNVWTRLGLVSFFLNVVSVMEILYLHPQQNVYYYGCMQQSIPFCSVWTVAYSSKPNHPFSESWHRFPILRLIKNNGLLALTTNYYQLEKRRRNNWRNYFGSTFHNTYLIDSYICELTRHDTSVVLELFVTLLFQPLDTVPTTLYK